MVIYISTMITEEINLLFYYWGLFCLGVFGTLLVIYTCWYIQDLLNNDDAIIPYIIRVVIVLICMHWNLLNPPFTETTIKKTDFYAFYE